MKVLGPAFRHYYLKKLPGHSSKIHFGLGHHTRIGLLISVLCASTCTIDEACFGAFSTFDTDDAGWIIVSDEEQGFDLLLLQDGKFELLAEAELDTGKYTQIRLKITDELDENDEPKTYVVVDGEKYALTVPSGTKSGLKLTHGFNIESDTETVLYIDFDADKSVNQTGNGEYKLKPTIKVMTELT